MYGTEYSFLHIERSEKSVINIGRAAESLWMTEFSVTYSTCFGPASCLVFLTVYKIFVHLKPAECFGTTNF
jgi:hypothetical protein